MNKNEYLEQRAAFWDKTNKLSKKPRFFSDFYHKQISHYYRFYIPAGKKVLELGCGNGRLLSALKPEVGVGIDFSQEAINQAKQKANENIRFLLGSVETIQDLIDPDTAFDFIILSDLINDLWDVQSVLLSLVPFCRKDTRIILNYYSRIWQLPLSFGKLIGQANHLLQQNWFTPHDVENILYLAGFESLRKTSEFLFPFPCPIIAPLFNRFLARIVPFKWLNLANFMVGRLQPVNDPALHSVSVVVPARNESGNIRRIIESTPELGSGTELIFVEGNSTDDTYETIQREIQSYPEKNIKVYKQTGKGKGDAVRLGYKNAAGEVLMILDADLTVPPDCLPFFYKALIENKGEFINGVRLVYPMESEAMRFANLIGNKGFSIIFSWLIGQTIKDTLCGTKVMWKADYDVLAANRHYFGDFDPFGDYDLIFGAAKLNLKIVDLPIRYKDRTYGTTNISRWRHGFILLRMVIFAARKIKFF